MATLGFFGFILILFAFGLIGLVIFVVKKFYWVKEDPRNEELVINLLSDYTDGYGLLLVKDKESNKDLIHITGSPRDIDYIRVKDKDFIVKDQDLFVRKDLYITLGNSTHRNIKIAFPDKPEQVPEEIKNTKFGEMAMKFIADRNAEKDSLEVQKIREKNMLKMTKQTEGLGIAEEIIGTYADSMKEFAKSKIEPPKPKDE